MKFAGSIKNVGKLVEKLNAVNKEIEINARSALAEVTLNIHSRAVKSIQEHSSKGAAVTRYNPKRIVSPSVEGNPPNSDRGILVKSIQFEVDNMKMIGRVGTNLLYGAYLEFGTLEMGPRPWLRPAFAAERENIIKTFRRIIKDATSRVA